MNSSIRYSRVFLLIVLAGLAALILWPYFGKMTVPDESTFIYEGALTARGLIPYKDFFDFIFPGTFLAVSAIIHWCGGVVSLSALRLSALLMLGTCTGLTLDIGRRYLSPPWLLSLGLLFWILNLPGGMEIQHHLFSTFFGMLSAYCMWRYVALTQHQKWLVLAGLAVGLSTLCTQSLGGMLGITLSIALILSCRFQQQQRWGHALKTWLLSFAFPAALPMLLCIIWLWHAHALSDFRYDTATWLLEGGYRQTSSTIYLMDGFTKFWSIIASITRDARHVKLIWVRPDLTLYLPVLVILFILPLLGLCWPPVYLWRKRQQGEAFRSADWPLITLWLAALGFMLATLSYPNTRLVGYHGFIPCLLSAMFLQTVLKNKPRLSRMLFGVWLAFALTTGLVQAMQSYAMLTGPRFVSYGTAEKELYNDRFPQEYVPAYNQLTQLIRMATPSGKTLFIYNQAPELYLLTQRDNPTRYQLLMALYNTPEQIKEATQAVAAQPPAILIYDRQDELDFTRDYRFHTLRRYDYHLHGLEALLSTRYHPVAQMASMTIFAPNPTQATTIRNAQRMIER